MAVLDERLNYDRVTAAKLGQTAQSLDQALYSAFGQSQVSIIYTQLNQYYVVLEVAPEYWQTPEGLKNVYFHPPGTRSPTASGNVPLATMASNRTNTTPLALNHTGLFPSVTVSFNLAPDVSLSDATLEIAHQSDAAAHGHILDDPWLWAGTLLAYQQLSAPSRYWCWWGRRRRVRSRRRRMKAGRSVDHYFQRLLLSVAAMLATTLSGRT